MVVLQTQNRQGTYESNQFDATKIPDGTHVRVSLLIPDVADYENPNNSVTITVAVLDGGDWRPLSTNTWTGAPRVGKDGTVNPVPTMVFLREMMSGYMVKATLDVPNPMRLGVDVSVTSE